MANFRWDPDFELGVAAMDQEHKCLIRMMDDLHAAHARGASAPVLGAKLQALGSYTVSHFKHEERYMESVSFPQLRTHKLIHKNLLEQFGQHAERFKKTGALDKKFFDFLWNWLSAHIKGIDRKYSPRAKAA